MEKIIKIKKFFFQNKPTVTLKILNKIYLANDSEIKTKFINDSKTYFNTTIDKIDTSNPVHSANIINDWVSNNTNHKIEKFMDSGMYLNIKNILKHKMSK